MPWAEEPSQLTTDASFVEKGNVVYWQNAVPSPSHLLLHQKVADLIPTQSAELRLHYPLYFGTE